MVEAVPEDLLGGITREGGKAVATAGRKKVDLIVEIPMFETVLVAVMLARRGRGLAKFPILAHAREYTEWSLQGPVNSGGGMRFFGKRQETGR
jgi:hypothetical protein